MRSLYKKARAKGASLLNGFLLPKFGVKIVRSYPKNFRYDKTKGADDGSLLALDSLGTGEKVDVHLREGTSDWMTFDQIFIDEDYDLRPLPRHAELMAYYRAACAAGTPLIVDLGANIGLSSLYFSMIWPDAQIVAIEPDAGNYSALRRNIATRPKIDALQAGAGSREGRLRIVDPTSGKNAFTTMISDAPDATIDIVTVPKLLETYSVDKGFVPFIMKIDIEGAEAELFSAGTDWIDAFPIISIELHDWLYPGKKTALPFLRAIADRDRDFVYLDENIFSIKNRLLPDVLTEGIETPRRREAEPIALARSERRL